MKAIKPCAGHLQERGGYYHTVISVYVNGKRKTISRTTGLPVKNNLRKAQKILEERKNEIDEHGLSGLLSREERLKFGSMLFTDYMMYVIERKKPDLAIPTYVGYKHAANGRIREFFEPKGITLDDMSAGILDDFISFMSRCGLNGTSQNDYLRQINMVLRYAVRRDHIEKNPMDKVDRPRKSKRTPQFYSAEEAKKLLKVVKNEGIYIPVLLSMFYGLRRSEALGLQWSSIDWEHNLIHIDHTAIEDRTKEGSPTLILEHTKTESSKRTLPLIPYVRKELINHRKQQEYYRKVFRTGYSKKWLDCVCVDPTGELITPSKLDGRFSNCLKKAGLRHIRFHDLRHSCASMLVANAIPMKQVQNWLGHSTYSTTADIYAHLTPAALDESAKCMEMLLVPDEEESEE